MNPITVVFFGKSGSGKGTQADLLLRAIAERDPSNKAIYVETGARFRSFVNKDTGAIAKKILDVMSNGKFLPPFIPIWMWTQLLVDELRTGREHLVFDGVARQPEEGPILDKALQFLERGKPFVVLLDVGHDVVTERLLKRGRFDDKHDKIVERLKSFEKDAMPSVNHFKQSPHVKFVTVNGDQTIEKVHEDVLKALGI